MKIEEDMEVTQMLIKMQGRTYYAWNQYEFSWWEDSKKMLITNSGDSYCQLLDVW